jgi:molybdopterin-guanine dinucleotide biosynthesis adapter protein
MNTISLDNSLATEETRRPCIPPEREDLSDIPIIAISGYSKSGKTTLIEKLTPELEKRGYRVATIKHTHHEIADPGKDTERHLTTGCELSMLVSGGRMVVIKPTPTAPSFTGMLRMLGGDYDLILAEGFKGSPLPKMAIVRAEEELTEMENLLGVITAGVALVNSELPLFGRGDVLPIADLIEREVIIPKRGRISLFVNGEKVPLLPFPRAVLAKGIAGMLSSLKGIGGIRSVEISIANPGEVVKP